MSNADMIKAEMQEKILSSFKDQNYFEVRRDEQLLPDSWRKSHIDYVVYQKKSFEKKPDKEYISLLPNSENILSPFCIVINTSDSKNGKITRKYAKQVIKKIIDDSSFWFGIVIDTELIVYTNSDDPSSKYEWIKPDLKKVEKIISQLKNLELKTADFRDALTEIILKFKPDSKREELILEILKSSIEDFDFYQYGRNITVSQEDQFDLLGKLIDEKSLPQKLCRYTSSNSLHRILNNNVESMCGLAVMNDKSEGCYLDKCLSPTSSPNIWARSQSEIDDYNDAFITSLCNIGKSDDLTMWRLYGGEDGDGVCLEYEIDQGIISRSPNLLLMPVCYGNNNNIIIQLFRLIMRLPLIKGFRFVLSYRNIFRYFVKPDGFKIEEEYRLLLIWK